MRQASAILAPLDKKARTKELKAILKTQEKDLKWLLKAIDKTKSELERLA